VVVRGDERVVGPLQLSEESAMDIRNGTEG